MTEEKPETKTNDTLHPEEPNIINEPTEISSDERWLIRDCDTYYGEYKECTSFRGRFHQYFIFGETLDCNQWKKDYDNCSKYESSGDCKAGLAVIKSEKARRMERLRAHYSNNVWQRRETPPEDWDKPLPEWLQKRDENTLLAEKAREIREGREIEKDNSFCAIM